MERSGKAVRDSLSVAGVKCLASVKTPEEKSRCEESYTSFTQAIHRVSCGGGEDSQSDNGAGAGARPNGDNALDGLSSSESPLLARNLSGNKPNTALTCKFLNSSLCDSPPASGGTASPCAVVCRRCLLLLAL